MSDDASTGKPGTKGSGHGADNLPEPEHTPNSDQYRRHNNSLPEFLATRPRVHPIPPPFFPEIDVIGE